MKYFTAISTFVLLCGFSQSPEQLLLQETVRESVIERLANHPYPKSVETLRNDLEGRRLQIRLMEDNRGIYDMEPEFASIVQMVIEDGVFPVWLSSFNLNESGRPVEWDNSDEELGYVTTTTVMGTFYERFKNIRDYIEYEDDDAIEQEFFRTFRHAWARTIIAANRGEVMGNPDWYLDEAELAEEEIALFMYMNAERMFYEDREELHERYARFWETASEHYQTKYEKLLYTTIAWVVLEH